MNYTPLVIALLAVAVLAPRVFDLDAFMTADEKIWIANTQGFTKNLALGRWGELMQQAHPGITTQWLGALAAGSSSLAAQKLPLVLGQAVPIGLIGYIFYRLWGGRPAVLLTLLLAFNPFLVAHTRVYAMDSLLAFWLLLSCGCLLLWQKTNALRYLSFSAAAGALAVLSKLTGVIIIPFALLFTGWRAIRQKTSPASFIRLSLLWLGVFVLTAILVLPPLIFDLPGIFRLLQDFFPSETARATHGSPSGYLYYIYTLLFFSTPLHMTALIILLPATLWYFLPSRHARRKKTGGGATLQVSAFVLFIILFTVQMTLAAKKGDRYLLPAFLFLDALVALTFFHLLNQFKTRRLLLVTGYALLIIGLLWQAADIIRLHPHTLAYVNPLTKPFYGNRRLGWGEGLDLAARYLNSKTNAEKLTAASIYPAEFAYKFRGNTTPLNHYEAGNADYVILYRSLLQRGPDAWHTDILNNFSDKTPEKIITLNNIDYVWIYKINN